MGNGYIFDSELERAIAGLLVLEACAEFKPPQEEQPWRQPEPLWRPIARFYSNARNHDEKLARFKEVFITPFFDYIYERLEDGDIVLSQLKRYKHKCEWFQRDYLFEKWAKETQKGEKSVSWHLYEYLFDQGLDFTIEPESISGKADLVLPDLVADTKIFKSSSSKSYISKGFKQVYTYLEDYNQSLGYLIIYVTGNVDLQVSFADETQLIPSLKYNNKTIFLLIIDIYPHEYSASKRGKLKPTIITEADLIEAIQN